MGKKIRQKILQGHTVAHKRCLEGSVITIFVQLLLFHHQILSVRLQNGRLNGLCDHNRQLHLEDVPIQFRFRPKPALRSR